MVCFNTFSIFTQFRALSQNRAAGQGTLFHRHWKFDRSRSIGCQHCRKSEAVRMDITVSPVSRGSWGKTGHLRRFEVFAIYLTETFLHSEYTSRYKVQYKLE